MGQLIDIVRYNVALCSETICELKIRSVGATKSGRPMRRVIVGPVFEDRAKPSIVDPRHPGDRRHPEHRRYISLKRECSLWLTVLHLEKIEVFGGASVTNFERASKSSHLPAAFNGRARFIRAAVKRYEALVELFTRGVKSVKYKWDGKKMQDVSSYQPKSWAHVESWVRERNAEREKALALRGEVKVHG